MEKQDLTGRRFGRLTVISEAGPKITKAGVARRSWLCRCDCGTEKIVGGNSLKNGNVRSCGCLGRDVHAKQCGLSSSPLYNIFMGMKKRCYVCTSQAYHNYGGRGITICDQWKDSFLAFYQWAITHGYEHGLSLDRIDNDKWYSPDNCRWTSRKVQGNNRRTNHIVELDGEKLTLAQWEERTGIRQETIRRRLRKGWTAERALLQPTRGAKEWEND